MRVITPIIASLLYINRCGITKQCRDHRAAICCTASEIYTVSCHQHPSVALHTPKPISHPCSLQTEMQLHWLVKGDAEMLQPALVIPVLEEDQMCQSSIDFIVWHGTKAVLGYKICYIIYSRWRPAFLHTVTIRKLSMKLQYKNYIIYKHQVQISKNLATVLTFIALGGHG